MFITTERDEVLRELIAWARADPTISAAASVGSGARRCTDEWSDIDLALRLAPRQEPLTAADTWRTRLGSRYDLAADLDLQSGPALYRVFLLADSLQIDVSFWPSDAYASTGEPFELIFGDVNKTTPTVATDHQEIIGWAWLYALHVRSAIARRQTWRALAMIEGLRDRVITLACLRHGLPCHQGRGVDRLPPTILDRLRPTLVVRPTPERLTAAFAILVDLLLGEVDALESALADRLRPPLSVLVQSAR